MVKYSALPDEMAVKYFKLFRAHEEITQLNVEVRWLQAWVDSKTTEIKQIVTELSAQKPLLSAELQGLFHCQHHVNNQHQLQLQHIYNLERYSGVQPIVEHGTGGEDEDEEVEGDKALRLDACMHASLH